MARKPVNWIVAIYFISVPAGLILAHVALLLFNIESLLSDQFYNFFGWLSYYRRFISWTQKVNLIGRSLATGTSVSLGIGNNVLEYLHMRYDISLTIGFIVTYSGCSGMLRGPMDRRFGNSVDLRGPLSFYL